jgi:ERCC4-type nuclease
MNKITIYADKGRESGVIEYLRNLCPIHKIKLCEQQMTVADFAIDYNGRTLAIIERKRWDDLANTIKTPSRKENHNKLLKYRKDTNFSSHIIYFIEGMSPFVKDPIAGVTANQLYGFLDGVALRDNCIVMYTMNLEHTAERIVKLAIKYDKIICTEKREEIRALFSSIPKLINTPLSNTDDENNSITDKNINNSITDKIHVKKNVLECELVNNIIVNSENNNIENKNNSDVTDIDDNVSECSFCTTNSNITTGTRTRIRAIKTFEEMRDDCLLELNGITKETIIQLRKYKVSDLLLGNINEKELSELIYPCSNNQFGSKTAYKIINQKTADHIKFLDAIRGITPKTEKLIISKYSAQELINLSISSISAIPKSKTLSLGKSTATLIHNIINS